VRGREDGPPKDIDFECNVNELNQGFQVDNDLLTPTLKMRRPQLLKFYQAKIDKMYGGIRAAEAASKKASV
jgi:long-chain acyl-CoA synthetase